MRNTKDESCNTDNRVRRSNTYLIGNPEGEENRGRGSKWSAKGYEFPYFYTIYGTITVSYFLYRIA